MNAGRVHREAYDGIGHLIVLLNDEAEKDSFVSGRRTKLRNLSINFLSTTMNKSSPAFMFKLNAAAEPITRDAIASFMISNRVQLMLEQE
jgi:hypothetical protein